MCLHLIFETGKICNFSSVVSLWGTFFVFTIFSTRHHLCERVGQLSLSHICKIIWWLHLMPEIKNWFKHGLQLKNQEIMKIQQSLEYCTFLLFMCRYWLKSWTPIETNWFAHQVNYHWTLPHRATQTGTSHLQNPSWPLDQPMDEPYGPHLWEHRKGSDLHTVKSNYDGLSKDQNIFPPQARLMKQWK